MEVEEHPAAQALTNVHQGKEIVTMILTVLAIWNVAKTTVILHWDFLVIMTVVMSQAVLMEVEEQPAAQIQTNVRQGREIVTLILNVLAI